VPPLWLAVLADGHLVRGPHWFLGGGPQPQLKRGKLSYYGWNENFLNITWEGEAMHPRTVQF
jgi:hypothetical protein